MKNKLADARGETLIEVLASILIGALSIALLFGAVMASGRMEKAAQEVDEAFYEDLSQAEGRDTATGSNKIVEVANFTDPTDTRNVNVTFYGGEGARSYALAP